MARSECHSTRVDHGSASIHRPIWRGTADAVSCYCPPPGAWPSRRSLCVILCVGQLSDLTVRYVAVPTVLVVCGYRVLAARRFRSGGAALVAAAATSVPCGAVVAARACVPARITGTLQAGLAVTTTAFPSLPRWCRWAPRPHSPLDAGYGNPRCVARGARTHIRHRRVLRTLTRRLKTT